MLLHSPLAWCYPQCWQKMRSRSTPKQKQKQTARDSAITLLLLMYPEFRHTGPDGWSLCNPYYQCCGQQKSVNMIGINNKQRRIQRGYARFGTWRNWPFGGCHRISQMKPHPCKESTKLIKKKKRHTDSASEKSKSGLSTNSLTWAGAVPAKLIRFSKMNTIFRCNHRDGRYFHRFLKLKRQK